MPVVHYIGTVSGKEKHAIVAFAPFIITGVEYGKGTSGNMIIGEINISDSSPLIVEGSINPDPNAPDLPEQCSSDNNLRQKQ